MFAIDNGDNVCKLTQMQMRRSNTAVDSIRSYSRQTGLFRLKPKSQRWRLPSHRSFVLKDQLTPGLSQKPIFLLHRSASDVSRHKYFGSSEKAISTIWNYRPFWSMIYPWSFLCLLINADEVLRPRLCRARLFRWHDAGMRWWKLGATI